ncbi:MAG: type II toxin-antitoxin system MqsA family antitoxin [Chitinivibrionales bacterium]|nr:type II toxin-antitoxin system MqsA family antitoxin [Chitinivibrionales bacterium]
MKNYNECPVCGSDQIEKVTKKEIFKYKGQNIEVSDYTVYYCKVCGEGIADPKSRKKSERILRDAQRIFEGYLTSSEIRNIRMKFNLTQDEFSKILGGGAKAFARYETGKILQSKPMDNLLRTLRDYPEAIESIKKQESSDTSYCPLKILGEEKSSYNPMQEKSIYSPKKENHLNYAYQSKDCYLLEVAS